jgi:hypothetical protein
LPPLPSKWLRDRGLVEFASSASASAWLYARGWAEARPERAGQHDSFQAFIELGATDFALAPLYRGSLIVGEHQILENSSQPDLIFPIAVSDDNVADAVYKTDCGPFMGHEQKKQSELRPWDVFTFAGDMSKFELLGIGYDINVLADPKVMQAMMEALAGRYAEAGLGRRVVESGLLAAQGLVWFAKLALLRGEDYTDIRGLGFIDRYLPEIA